MPPTPNSKFITNLTLFEFDSDYHKASNTREILPIREKKIREKRDDILKQISQYDNVSVERYV